MQLRAPYTPNQIAYFERARHSWLNVAEGAKRSGKDVLTTDIFCSMLEVHPNTLHLVGGVSSGAAGGIILEGDGLGIKAHFTAPCGTPRWRKGKYENKNCLFVKTLDGREKVLIIAGGKTATSKDFFQGLGFGMAWITEAPLCHISFNKEVIARVGASKDPKVFHTLNPEPPNHEYYEDFLNHYVEQQNKNPNYGYNWGHFTPIDNLGLTEKQLRAFVASVPRNTVWYDRDIKGIRAAAENRIFPNFDCKLHVVKSESRPYKRFMGSVDFGSTNRFVFQLWGQCYDGIWYCIKEYCHDAKATRVDKSSEEYIADIIRFIGDTKVDGIIIDPSAKDFRVSLSKKGYATHLGNNEVAEGIRTVADALHLGIIKFNDCCKETIKSIENYMWDSKYNGAWIPLKLNDHEADATRYFCNTPNVVTMYRMQNRR